MDIRKSQEMVSGTAGVEPESKTELLAEGRLGSHKVSDTGKRKAGDAFQEESCSRKKVRFESPETELTETNLDDREVDDFDKALKEARVNKNIDSDTYIATENMGWYQEIVRRMEDEKLSLDLLKDKNTEEILDFLISNDVIPPSLIRKIKNDNVDLEGSPFW